MRLVIVEWLDSHQSSGGWAPVKEIHAELPVMRSVGWMLHDTKDCVVLVPNHAVEQGVTPEQACGEMTIPKKCIKRIHRLKDPNE